MGISVEVYAGIALIYTTEKQRIESLQCWPGSVLKSVGAAVLGEIGDSQLGRVDVSRQERLVLDDTLESIAPEKIRFWMGRPLALYVDTFCLGITQSFGAVVSIHSLHMIFISPYSTRFVG